MINVIFAFLIGAIIVGMVGLAFWVKVQLDHKTYIIYDEVARLRRGVDDKIDMHENRWHRRPELVRCYSPNYYNVKPPYDRPHGSDIFKAEKVPPIDKEPEQEVEEDPEESKD